MERLSPASNPTLLSRLCNDDGGLSMGRPKTIRDEKILSIARILFTRDGCAASTREIARRAGISEAVIFQRYPTKDDLFFAAMEPPALVAEGLFAAGVKEGSTPERLEAIALGLMAYFRELMPIIVRLITHPSFDFKKHARHHADSPLARIRSGLIGFLKDEKRAGRVANRDVEPSVMTLIAAVHSLAVFEMMGVHGGAFDDATVRAMVRSLWLGLAPARKR